MKPNELHILMQDSMLTLEPLIKPHLCPPPRGLIEDRIAIYAQGFYGRLEDTLMNDYGSLLAIMGESKFSHMCRKYIDRFPSYHYSLNTFGKNLSQFLSETSPYNKKPYLSEIAAFEWAESEAVVSQNSAILAQADLQQLSPDQWPGLTFQLHPSCQILNFYWNSLALIEAVRRGHSIRPPLKLKNPHSVLVWRRELQVRYYKLNRLEDIVLKAIVSQASFVEICQHLCQQMPEEEIANYIVQKLHAWLNEQLFVKQEAGISNSLIRKNEP